MIYFWEGELAVAVVTFLLCLFSLTFPLLTTLDLIHNLQNQILGHIKELFQSIHQPRRPQLLSSYPLYI